MVMRRRSATDDRPARASWLGRLRERAREQRGIAVVEAAFVTPIFFMLIFGVVEGGMYMQDKLAVSSAVRAGARSASAWGAVAQADLYTVYQLALESTALNAGQLDYIVIYKATGFGEAPTDDGGGPAGGCRSGVPVTGVCNVYRAADLDKAIAQVEEESAQEAAITAGVNRTLNQSKIWFGCVTTGPNAGQSPDRYWCPSSRKDARSDNNRSGPDFVGVYMKARHNFVTGMFGRTAVISDQSVIQIEPRTE
jgi:hypothetical protein